jgi:hypothetical protein
MTDAEIDALTKRVDNLVEAINREIGKAKHTYTFSHDDGVDDEIDASATSTEATDDAENSDDGNPGDTDLDDVDEEDEEDDDVLVGKAEVTAGYQNVNSRGYRPGPRSSSLHPSAGLATSAAVQHSRPHIFDSRVAFIKDRDGVTKPVAMQRARLEYPDDYENYQKFHAGTSTQDQYARRQGYGTHVGKAGPVTAQSLIASEIRKGFSPELAAQRVAQQHGYRAFDTVSPNMRKAADIADTFESAAEDVWLNNDHLDRCESLRKTRLENRRLFKMYQRA